MKIQIRPIEKLVLYARTNPTNKVEALRCQERFERKS